MATAPLRIEMLGGFAVSAGDRTVPESAWRLRRGKSLVKLLALAPERRMHRDRVGDLLWPGRQADAVANNLRQVLYVARRAFEGLGVDAPRALALRDDVLVLGDGWPVWIDVEAFEAGAAAARERPSVEAYRAALALYAGELLPGDRYEDWSAMPREALRERRLALLVGLAGLLAHGGDDAGAIETLQRATADDPLHEEAHRRLMRLFTAGGRPQQALAQYQQLRRVLRSELAADPDPETRGLYRTILADGAPGREPPTAAVASNLPHQLTSFIGRERELSELGDLLERTRLLTLTGPGGCGKTRLALELAGRRAAGFADGVRLVELASLSEPELVLQATATALGLQLGSERDPVELLVEQVGERRLMLAIDNCEHVIGECARLVERLLRACPRLVVLTTSREPLRIRGEVTWRVPSLSLPGNERTLEQLERGEAVRLFCERAADTVPGFVLEAGNADAVAGICLRLDGMPLALELAAARAGVLAPAQILDRLGDSLGLLTAGSRAGLTRQQTLRATLAWSHDLLSAAERTLFRRLGVFAGPFSVEAVEGVCAGAGIDAAEALDLLGRLVEKSLVQVERPHGDHRYRLLETVRQYAGERLREVGERDGVAARHRDWYLALAEAADPTRAGGEGLLHRLEREHDNLRAALASALDRDHAAALRLTIALFWFWMARGYFAEGARWTAAALALNDGRTDARARALVAAAALDIRRGMAGDRVALVQESLAIRRALGDRLGVVRALQHLGDHLVLSNELGAGDRAYAEGVALVSAPADAVELAGLRQGNAMLAYFRGDLPTARARLAESVALLTGPHARPDALISLLSIALVVVFEGPGGSPRCLFEGTYYTGRTVTSRLGAAYGLCNIAILLRSERAYDEARETLERALGTFRDLGDAQGTGLAVHLLGNLARSAGDLELASEWLDEALVIRRELGDRRDIGATISSQGLVAIRAGDRERGHRLLADALARFERSEDGPALAGMALNLGCVALDEGELGRAWELLTRSGRMWREQRTLWNATWPEAVAAEAALAAGEPERARAALARARAGFESLEEVRGLARVAELEAELAGSTGVQPGR
jgi:predicted ATPase/DNA-binding SARP family transcriptional activator